MRHPVRSAIRSARLAVAILFVLSSVALGQHPGGSAPPTPTPPKEGSQFDFLVGQWELVVQPQATTLGQRIHGTPKLLGTWKAWRALDGWGTEDELRLTDASGNPRLLSHQVRFFDSAARRWSISAIDVYKGIVSTSTAEWRNGEMIISGRGTDAEGRAYESRAIFSKITPSTFRYRTDRSYDGGKTWSEGVTRIEAKRVAATAPR
jgi:hypothetical protein